MNRGADSKEIKDNGENFLFGSLHREDQGGEQKVKVENGEEQVVPKVVWEQEVMAEEEKEVWRGKGM